MPEVPSTPLPGEDASKASRSSSSSAAANAPAGADSIDDDVLLQRLRKLKGDNQQPAPPQPAVIDGAALDAAFARQAAPSATADAGAAAPAGHDPNVLVSLDDSISVSAPSAQHVGGGAPLLSSPQAAGLPAGFQYMSPRELQKRWTSVLILDLRTRSAFATSSIQPITGEELAIVNVPVERLKRGADVSSVRHLLTPRHREHFDKKATFPALAILVADDDGVQFGDDAPLRWLVVRWRPGGRGGEGGVEWEGRRCFFSFFFFLFFSFLFFLFNDLNAVRRSFTLTLTLTLTLNPPSPCPRTR